MLDPTPNYDPVQFKVVWSRILEILNLNKQFQHQLVSESSTKIKYENTTELFAITEKVDN